MKVAQKIEKKIGKIKEGTTFKYQQLSIESSEYSAATKAIERFIEKEKKEPHQNLDLSSLPTI